MPTIHRLENAKICVYPGDHAPPHFHVVGPNTNVQVRIDTLQVLNGHYDVRDLAQAMSWAGLPGNLGLLWQKWRELNERD